MPFFILPFEVFETMFYSLTSFLNFMLSSKLICLLFGTGLLFHLLGTFLPIIKFDFKDNKILKKKKYKLTLKERIMRLIGFDHYKEKEDK